LRAVTSCPQRGVVPLDHSTSTKCSTGGTGRQDVQRFRNERLHPAPFGKVQFQFLVSCSSFSQTSSRAFRSLLRRVLQQPPGTLESIASRLRPTELFSYKSCEMLRVLLSCMCHNQIDREGKCSNAQDIRKQVKDRCISLQIL
jgi:hypothetical protein